MFEQIAYIFGLLSAIIFVLGVGELVLRMLDRLKRRRWVRRRVQRVLDGIQERQFGFSDAETPALLKPQAGPLCDEHYEKVVTLRQFGAQS